MIQTSSGLQYQDTSPGTGSSPEPGQTCVMHYTGWLYENGAQGEKFDSSRDRAEPFVFALGDGMVIKGWDEGVQGMKEGGRRILIIPASLGYGARGAGGVIPPNATLLFDVAGATDVKAVYSGVANPVILPDVLELPMDFESFRKAGVSLGSGALLICDQNTCIVDLVKVLLQFFRFESCGKCTPCRVGTQRAYEIVDRISQGQGRTEDLDTLIGIAQKERLVEVNGFDVDIEPTTHLAFVTYEDRPGMVGVVGGILGDAAVNIAGMQVSRQDRGGEALVALSVDSAIPADTLVEIATAMQATTVRAVDLS